MNNLSADQIQKEKEKTQEQIHSQVNAEERQIYAEDRQINAEPRQLDAQARCGAYAQGTLMANAEQQIPVVIPDTAALLDGAYAEVRGRQRMSKKERERRVEVYEQKHATSELLCQNKTRYEAKNKALRDATADIKIERGELKRALIPLLDAAPEALEENRRKLEIFSSGSEKEQFDEFNRIFDEFLAMDIDKLKYTDDRWVAEHYEEYMTFCKKGWQMNLILTLAKDSGLPVEPERERQIHARSSLFEEVGGSFQALGDVVGSPYYALLRKMDTEKYSESELADRGAEAFKKGNNALGSYYTGVAMRRGGPKYKRGSDPNGRLRELYAEQQEKYEANVRAYPQSVALCRQRQLEDGWGDHTLGYDVRSKLQLKSDAALKGAGVNIAGTRSSVAKFVFAHRSGIRFGEPLTAEQKAQFRAVGEDIDNTLENNNTLDTGAALMAEMARGILEADFGLDLSTPIKLAENAAQLEHCLRAYYDYFQITESSGPLKAATEKLLTKEERAGLMEIALYAQLTQRGLNTVSQTYANPKYAQYLSGELGADDETIKRFEGAQAFFTENRKLFETIAKQPDGLHVPDGFAHSSDYRIAAANADKDFPMDESTTQMDAEKVAAFYADLKKARGGN